ncbi:KICSTOR complex protein SZT2-like isoform X2 [Macrosteles quadrilineatus]|uniref:KICSTOR complex protein SZT2-like isoform X2 n=1 Tax=Macrosteles quadrilineatus TaxID=74068 RepID=UPI0023E15F92|nr:KICSTOR complex protein SZT2-like isoform X2 [Macrosteles quadrilineatus]
MASEKSPNKTGDTRNVLVAGVIYLLMNKSYHISRNVRAQWFLQHLNTTISLQPSKNVGDSDCELAVVSILPQDCPEAWNVGTRHLYQYLVTTNTNVIFFSEIYSTVYCLDMSPSISAVDIQHGKVMLDEIVDVLNESLSGVVSKLIIPGSEIMFEPQIFVTVIVHTPFFTSPAQQVLVQGWQVTQDNLAEFLAAIRKQLQLLEDTIAEVSALAYDQLEALRIRQMESDRLVGGLFEESSERVQMSTAEIPMVSPDSGFINLLRYGMLALRLLPHSSLSNLVVVTDGVISLPDIHVLDLVLTQLRTNAVAVSFLHVGSQFHPHCAQGLVPYSELMQFISCATFGTYIPYSGTQNYGQEGLNTYHEAFLTWSFNKGANVHELSTPAPRMGEWFVSNHSFYGNREPQLLMKKQTEDNLNASLASVLCCRLHEGFMIKNISVKESQLEVCLMLPWANHIYIEYIVLCEWPVPPNSSVRFYISIKAPYEFLHDITCLIKKQFQSPYRQAVVTRFWTTIKTLAQSDLLLAHLDSFSSTPLSFALPETIRSGMPLFYLPSNSGPQTLSSSDPSCPLFAHYWRPVCLLDPSVWHKWMHSQTLSLILQHDLPLPKFLHVASPNGRFQGLQCRHAAATLYNFLKDWTSFVLIENHSYLKFLSSGETDKTPSWFYVLRVQQKPPCAVIHIAFLGGTPGKLRHQIIEQLKAKISALTVPQRLTTKHQENNTRNQGEGFVENQSRSNVPCSVLLNKPLEKILIRYERMPSEFGTVVFPDGTQPQTAVKPPRPTSTLVTTLSRYLHHRRWVWTVSPSSRHILHVSNILSLLTEMRLQEGFRFAHSTAGIINMVLEIQMKCCDQEADHMCDNYQPCIIQYVLFPLHTTSNVGKGSTSEEEDTEVSESENSLELIAECWIEPQHGLVARGSARRSYMENLPYHQLADVMWRMDAECITKLLTFEQLRLMSQNPQIPVPPRMDPLEAPPRNPLENWPHATALSDQRIQKIPFAYNVISILPESQQVELQFPLFIQDLGEDWCTKNSTHADAPNTLLLDTLFQQLKDFHDKELFLSPVESKQFIELICKRQRNLTKHPVPFPRRDSSDSSANSSRRKCSDKESRDEDKENEWPKIPCDDGSKNKHSVTTSSGGRKSCGPLYRMYPRTPPNLTPPHTDVDRDMPRWRFFVKRSSQSYIILTFVPASYRDCKALMLNAEPKAWVLQSESDSSSSVIPEQSAELEISEAEKQIVIGSKLDPEAKPFVPMTLQKESPLPVANSSPLSNKRWIEYKLDSVSNISDHESSNTDLQQSTWELSKGTLDPSSPFRVRARSWEPIKPQSVLKTKKHSSPRVRTRSVGSKYNEYKMRKKLNCDYDTFSMISNLPSKPPCKPVLGHINVPVYVYGCSLDNLMDSLILKTEYKRDFKDLFWRRTCKTDIEGEFESDDNSDVISQTYSKDSSDDLSVKREGEVKQHAQTIIQAFTKSFGVSLFKALHRGHHINAANVQTAMEECEEALVEINITNYLQTVCRHLKEMKDKVQEDEEQSLVEIESFKSAAPCIEYHHLHNLIKDKFHHIITSCFKPVPTNPEFYFCSPNWERDHQVDINTVVSTNLEDRRNLELAHDFDNNTSYQTEFIEFRSDQGSNVGGASPWETVGSVTTPDEAHTSLLSNRDSDSLSIFPEEECDEDISPLFLQLICTIKSNGQMGNCSVQILPTCLEELVQCLDGTFANGKIDVKNLSVSLDILCLTLPQQSKSLVDTALHSSPNTTSSNDEQFPLPSNAIDNLQNLPEYQHKAVSLCVEEIKWLMRDEIAAFLLDQNPVTEATLQLVADHIISSPSRASCVYQTVPLQFVFGAEQSLAVFLMDFSMMRVPGYCLKSENEFFYVVKDPSHRGSQDSEHSSELWITTNEEVTIKNTNEPRMEAESKTSGWSSVAAWHAEVANLMEAEGLIFEGSSAGEGEMNECSDWLRELESRRAELPNFWLIMRVNKEEVICYFHCRFLELETPEVKLYSLVQKNIVNSIKMVCKTVNQKMLLNNLHDTRMCNQLLEPESMEDIWRSSHSSAQIHKPDEEATTSEADTPVDYLEASLKFLPGSFSCPVVWETHFTLHPRLKTGPTKPGLSRGIQALRTVLNRFSVNNRKNMFVYQDHLGNVFYLRLYENVKSVARTVDGEENSPLSVSRSSSINSLNNTGAKKNEDATSSIVSAWTKELRPRLKSFGEVGDSLRQEEFLTLKVHGISEAGAEVKSELVQVLHNRLDDAVLEVLSVMLARNPMCKLSPEDVHFIQKPYRMPENTVQFSLPPEALDNLQAVLHYLRQNLMQFMHTPKYTDTRAQFHLQDYSHPKDPSKQVSEDRIFLYNQSPSSGNKGIACVAGALVDSLDNIVDSMSYQPPNITAFQDQPFTASQFNSLTATNSSDGDSGSSVRLEFRIWKQGRVNVESLTLKLKAAVRYALWDLITEMMLLTAPLSSTQPLSLDSEGDDSPLNPVYQSVIAPWMQFGYKLGAPAVSTHIVALSQRHPVNITLSEVSNLVSCDGTSGYVYYQKDTSYLPYKWSSPPYSLPLSTTCLLIARNLEQWCASVRAEPRLCLDKLEPKSQKVLQKFSPFLISTTGDIIQFVPRQRFLIAIVNNEKIILHTYNWAKDLVELLVKQIGMLGQWLTARSNLQIGVTCQKMGLFLNQPMARKSDSQVTNNPFMSQIGDVESLMTFRAVGSRGATSSGGPTVSAAHLQEVLRDTRPAPLRQQTSDLVVASVQQLLDTRAQDKRGHQKKLYTMWQMRGGTSNTSIVEDVLEVFMLYSRVIHYCVTPLLFLPRWRVQSASTRDSSLKSHKSISQSSLQESSPILEEKWHQNLCSNFINEYKQYLQSLGFIPVQIVASSPKKGFRSAKTIRKEANPACYLQKSLLGGILLFELSMSEPFFYAKLHALECSRLEGKASSGLISQFTLSFLDECDKVKVLMHLHSFTYDYHLRTLTRFVCGVETCLRTGYHVTGFLDDFLKYYSKAPNYAYSLVHSGNLVMAKMSTPANMLFNYLLSHKENYPMKVIRVAMPGQELDDNPLSIGSPSEYVLVQQQSSATQVMYRDSQDNKQVYEYDIVLVVANEESSDPSILRLCYYILLTSRREPYAKLENERKLGKFCTVSTANPLTLYTLSRETTPPIPEETPEELAEAHQSSGSYMFERRSSSHNVEIKAESVNYLGYYSSHEQFMQQLIMEQANKARGSIEDIITQVSLHCRTHFLWNKLTSSCSTGLIPTYAEFSELLNLASIEPLSDVDSRVSPVLTQPLVWYQGLAKLLQAKYTDFCKSFTSPDTAVLYHLVLHPRVPLGFIMITLDSNASQGEVNIVTSKTLGNEQVSNVHLPTLIEDVINACCYQLWTGLV